ncbi:MAG: glycosyltransferase [Planctomycetota bacterium]|jgi:glycosyltransferase involved in cell wall biosynthesis
MQSAAGKGKIKLALFWPKYRKVTFVDELVLALDKDRFSVIFIYLSGYGVDRNLLEEAGHKVFYLSDIKRINAFRLSILLKLIRILKEYKVDILHCHRHKPSFYGALAGMFAKTSVVLSHVHGLSRTRNTGRRWFNSFTLKRVNRVIGCARSVRDDVLKNNPSIRPEKVIALENSIDFERFANISITRADARDRLTDVPADAFVYGTVARFGPYKGHSFLIEAFERVKEKVGSAHLILVGSGPLKEEIQQQAVEASLDDSVHFLGRRDDVPELLRAMDAFVLPSIGSEGMPLAILEAMSAGVPCIASSLSGIPEVINNRDVGFLVPPGEPNALADAMIAVANTPGKKRRTLIEKAKERVRINFNHDVARIRLANTYEMEMSRYESDRRKKSDV